jgi:D,D-heptose 1,7-bisphosphate phosphatase
MQNKAVFLDRDGTINVDKNYVYKIEDLEFLPGVIEGLKRIQKTGFLLVIITNQSGIGRGYYTEAQYKKLMEELHKRLKKQGINITADYYCKHAPEENCECRKPNIKLIETAAREYDIDISKSFFIGDKTADILAGKNAGMKTILVKTGKAGKDGYYNVEPDYVAEDLSEAALMMQEIK